MVGMMNSNSSSPERLLALVTSAISATAISSKLDSLRQLSEIIRHQNDAASLSQLLPPLFDLQSDQHSPVRKLATEIIGDIGVKHVDFVPEIVYLLINVLEDRVPAVARQAITCGLNIFRSTLEKIAIQGLCTSELDDQLKSSWSSVLDLKENIYAIAFQPGSGGVRLLALKFVEAVILLYTPNPNGSPEPPSDEGTGVEFNVSWIRGGHPVLNIGDLSIEASKRLALLLDQLRSPTVKSVSNLVIIVLINSLATIVKKRPPYYGRILPVLLGLDPSNSTIEGMHGYGARHALKNAFLTCLKCTHQGAAPWRDRLVGALREMKAEGLEEEATHQSFKSNGGAEESNEDLQGAKEGKLVIKPSDDLTGKLKKRVIAELTSEVAEDNNVSVKRAKTTTSVSEESNKELNRNITVGTDEITSDATTSNRIDEDNGPVQQLVAMFGALVAQGERAVGSLEILISSISADLLADVVMANMRYLPSSHSQAKGDDELLVNMPIIGSFSQAKYPPSFLANVLSLSTSFPPVALQLNAHRSVSNVVASQGEEEALHNTVVSDSVEEYAGTSHEAEDEMVPAGLPTSSNATLPGMEVDGFVIPSDVHDISNLESEIPGLDSSARIDGFSETLGTSSVVSTDEEDASQEVVTSLTERSNLDLLPSVSTDRSERSEELSSKATVTDTTSMISSTATSLGLPCPVVLPKMSAPVVILADEQKDELQTTAFVRVIEAYKQIAVAGGSQVRFSLLTSLGLEFPSDLDPWKLLQNHVLEDYVSHEGHELTLRVLYRLFGEVEEERDLFSSTTAASAYEVFLLTVAKTLRDSFPPSDKSLSRLLGEAPSLPQSVLNLLEALCCPESCDKAEKESQSGDRVTQGLSTVWSLILLRPPIREDCLKIALQSAVHHLEEVRMKAIRLVANRLYPLSSISQQIEDFANQKMLSIVKGDVTVSIDAEGSITESEKDSNLQKPEQPPVSVTSKDLPSDTHPSSTLLSIPEAQQCMSLYFALCTKKHSLFREIFVVYKGASKAVKQAVQHHIPTLVRTMGSSSELLQIISDPPNGSEELLIQVLQTLTDGTVPSPELLFTIKKLYDSKLKDAEILIPILPFLAREEVLMTFPHLVNLPMDKFQAALARVLQGSPHSGPVLTPAEVLIAIHGIDPDKDGIPLKKVTDACNACFEQRQTFTQQVLAKALNQLVEQIPLPLLFMRTVLQAIGAFPALVEFIMDILSRLVSKQIWKYPKLWVGFLKCALLTKPQSFSVLLQLPPPQLENALNRTAALKAPLVAHASQPNIKSSLPRSTLVVLGIITEPQTSSQAETSQVQTVDASNSEKVITEKSKVSSNAS